MPKHQFITQDVARITSRAAEIREASFSKATSRYTLNTTEAALQACDELDFDPNLARIIGLALDGWWNDTMQWAEDHGGRK